MITYWLFKSLYAVECKGWCRQNGRRARCKPISGKIVLFQSSQCECLVILINVCYLEFRLDVYIYDYFLKKNLQASAKAFQAEGEVSPEPVGKFLLALPFVIETTVIVGNWLCPCALLCSAIDAPGGFLFEWWSVFWDIFIARTDETHSDVAASYIEVSTSWFDNLKKQAHAWLIYKQGFEYVR